MNRKIGMTGLVRESARRRAYVKCSRFTRRTAGGLGALLYTLFVWQAANAEVSQMPLYLGGGNVPGNLVLVPSVEWPTINSMANLGPYDLNRTYLGYFDPNKCYGYHYATSEPERHFYPVGSAVARQCAGQWSGNYMNWAATQTIDPFRSVLTGGLRVRDTPTETWLEKARHDGQGGTGIYPNRRLPASDNNAALVLGATPFAATNWVRTRIQGLGNRMRFGVVSNDQINDGATARVDYNPATHATLVAGQVYEVSIRVRVCVAGMLESNCRQYSQGYKPEGLIQQNAHNLRVGVFGYLNDGNMLRDGGVLRARQKFVGPTRIVPGQGSVANPNQEWNPLTGVFFANPDSADASATSTALGITINNSGVLNYLNRFGQMTSANHKNFDPVSELYYTALRYLRNIGNVPEYSNIPGNTGVGAVVAADGFPVITNWDDPIQYACQKNVILGIGDVYTHRDKNLPGNTVYRNDEPAMPTAVANDTGVNVRTWTNRVGQLEGLGNIGDSNSWSGRNNSAYMAGLAYFANTTDIRPDMSGTQTVSTHWVDVLEAQSLEPPVRNQYYLATKYGGFRPPDDFDPLTYAGPNLPEEWWHSNGQTLTSFGPNASPTGVNFARPDNYYLAGEADQMIASLNEAFARIVAELRSSASSVAANSTRVDTDTAVFQAAFDSTRWSGELQAFRIFQDGTIADTASWNAAQRLDDRTENDILTTRRIFTVTPPTLSGGVYRSTSGVNFQWGSLAASQQQALRQQPGGGPLVSEVMGQDRLNYLRGSRQNEQPSGPFRQRDSRLGDIVNSDPQFIHRQDFGYTLLAQSSAFGNTTVGPAYRAFRESAAYQNRPPMVVVGANDGMLHGFHAGIDGNGGQELFAFVPHATFENLYELTLQDYVHRYFVDGTPRIADAWLGTTLGWRTLVVGVTGAGGRSVFALDITDPTAMTASNVLWEFSHQNMGKTLGHAVVAPLATGVFGTIVTSGYDTTQDDGYIWILNPATGAVLHEFEVPTAGGELGAPLVVDLDGDRVADRIYVGDTMGNLWRFDISNSNMNQWGPPSGQNGNLQQGQTKYPLFVARDALGNRQAITGPLASAFTESGEHAIFFGTGSFYQVDDNVVPNDPLVDTFYGIIDRGQRIQNRSTLLEQEIITEQVVFGQPVRAVTANPIQSSHSGWYLDLVWKNSYGGPGPVGERVVSRPLVRGDRVIFPTLIPNPDPCSFGGDSWIMELNTFSGGRLAYSVFDLNDDGEFDSDDWIEIVEDGETIRIPVSGIRPDIGIIQTPAIITGFGTDESEIKVISGSSGELIRISERGGIGIGRQSWRQLR